MQMVQAAEGVVGGDVPAADCSQAAVQAAVDAAGNGATVVVPAGRCTWNQAVSIENKALRLRGAGSTDAGTVITYGGSGHPLVAIDAGPATGPIEVSGFRFVGGDANFWGGTAIQFRGPAGGKTVRIHHNTFDSNKQWSIRGSAATYGLIDHNRFLGSAHGLYLEGDGERDWSTPLVLGSADFFFVEDNAFAWDDWYGTIGAVNLDFSDGGRVVFRHNDARHGFIETHDRARNGQPSANAWEIYANTFRTDTNKWKGVDITAGTGVVWGNTFDGDWTVPIGAIDYKTSDPRGIGRCDGTDPADQNTPGETGWRCQYQIGSQGEGRTATGFPAYIWNNTKNGAPIGMSCSAGCEHVREGRDFINNGALPKPGYAAYPYPHPLQSAGSH